MFKRSAFIVVVLMLLFTTTDFAEGGIIVDGQEARFSGMRPDTGSVFLRVKNTGKADDALLGAEVNIKGAYAELHDVKEGAMMKVSRIPVPAGSAVQLKRGGLHIMLFGLPVEVKEGDEFTLTLIFEKAGKKESKVKLSGAGRNMHRH